MTSAFGTCPVESDPAITPRQAPIVWRSRALAMGAFCSACAAIVLVFPETVPTVVCLLLLKVEALVDA